MYLIKIVVVKIHICRIVFFHFKELLAIYDQGLAGKPKASKGNVISYFLD